MTARCLFCAALIALSGCSRLNVADYTHLVRSGFKVVSHAEQMDKLFQHADHFIGSDVSPSGTRTWNSEVFFGSRYILSMQVEVVVSSDGRSVVRVEGEPKFHLFEVASVDFNNGVYGASFNTSNQKEFGSAEMDAILQSKGDLKSLGIENNLKPVQDFDLYRKSCSQPRIVVRTQKVPRDNPIK